jgi:RNA polymerase sigma factor (sigma-70 family)
MDAAEIDLREQSEWLRALARRLVGAQAEDLAQDVALAAIEAPPPADRPRRRWLVRVLRNTARMRFRADERRARREAAVGTAEAATPDAALQLVETSRALCELVLALDEPLRRTVVGHYVEGLRLAELARRDGVAEATVRWRHARALAVIREGLDRRAGGDRRAWGLALAPMMKLGGAVMTKVAIGAVVAVVAAGGLWWWRASMDAPDARQVRLGVPAQAGSVELGAPSPAAPARPRDAGVGHVRRMTEGERRVLSDRIAAARARRASRPAGAAGGTAAPPSAMSDADQVLAQLMSGLGEVRAFVAECQATAPTPIRVFQGQLTLTGDPDVGTLIDAAALSTRDGAPLPAAFDDCVRARMQTLALPPTAVGDAFRVTYQFDLDDNE